MNYTYDAENFRRVFERSFTWLAGFRRSVGRSPKKTAMIDPMREETWSYERLDRETNRLANALKAVPGMNAPSARAVYAFFHGGEVPET